MNRCTSIISAYFCKDWLEGRIQNLLEQSEVPNIVAVALKDSEESKILARYPEVTTIITSDVPTVYAAWNMAIKACDTTFVNIANSDDRLSKFAIERMCNALQENPSYSLAYPDCHVVYELNGDRFPFELGEGDLFSGCFIGPVPTYRRKLHELYGWFPEDYVVAGDYWFWLNLQVNGVKFLHIKEKLGIFYDRSQNPSIENNLEYKFSNLTIFETAKAQEYWKKERDAKLL